ncbi:uncharacterized protein [Nicotiana tomentosiformis]|uniref:uncharacterized protein n=1 Tax=Nicotiana tomentosiformis TaxID=4098 RepID=UPI00388CEC6C
MSADELKRLDKFTKLHPPHFSGTPSEDAQEIFDRCHEILHNLGLVESNRVDFTAFQIHDPSKRWWQVYELGPVQQEGQTMIPVIVVSPRALPAWGGGQPGYGRPRGRAQSSRGRARCYAFLERTEVVASNAVITIGDSILVDQVYRSYVVSICGFETRANILLLDMVEFDVILGMDCLSLYHDILDCHAKTAQWMVEKEYLEYLAFVRDVSADTLIVGQVQKLKYKEITSVKVQWRGKPVMEATWEAEHDM